MSYVVGVDLGQTNDYTAISVVELPADDAENGSGDYLLRHLERPALDTSYTDVVRRVQWLCWQKPLRGKAVLVLDHTGVGRPVLDMCREQLRDTLLRQIIGVTITGGDRAFEATDHEDDWRVPKRDLVGALQLLFQGGRLRIAAGLAEAPTFVNELMNFRVKISTAGHDSYEHWREGQHDDLVLSVALACWWPERRPMLPGIDQMTEDEWEELEA